MEIGWHAGWTTALTVVTATIILKDLKCVQGCYTRCESCCKKLPNINQPIVEVGELTKVISYFVTGVTVGYAISAANGLFFKIAECVNDIAYGKYP
jgi:hypothetical protein